MKASRPAPALRDPFDVAVGARVRLLRQLRSVTLLELARHLGVSFQQVQKYEQGANRMTASALARAAGVLGVGVADLVGETPGDIALPAATWTLLSEPGAVDLLRAYLRVRDPLLRDRLLAFLTTLVTPAAGSCRDGA